MASPFGVDYSMTWRFVEAANTEAFELIDQEKTRVGLALNKSGGPCGPRRLCRVSRLIHVSRLDIAFESANLTQFRPCESNRGEALVQW
jgi:hypothetical protein